MPHELIVLALAPLIARARSQACYAYGYSHLLCECAIDEYQPAGINLPIYSLMATEQVNMPLKIC